MNVGVNTIDLINGRGTSEKRGGFMNRSSNVERAKNEEEYIQLPLSEYKRLMALEEELRVTTHRERERMSQFEAIFETMADAVVVYQVDGRPSMFNRATREMLMLDAVPTYDQNQPSQRRLASYTIRDEHGQMLAEEDLPSAHVLRGETFKGSTAVDVIFDLPDGSIRQASISGAPIYRDGKVTGGVTISHDVTERRRLEKRTHESLQSLMELAASIVAMPRNDGQREEKLFNFSQVIGEKIIELTRRVLGCTRVGFSEVDPETYLLKPIAITGFAPDVQKLLFDNLDQVSLASYYSDASVFERLKANEIVLLEPSQKVNVSDLTYIERVHTLIAPICSEGKLIGVLIADFANSEHLYTSEEISLVSAMTRISTLAYERERKQAELAQAMLELHDLNEQLMTMSKAQTNFFAIISHEFRNTLSCISGFSEMINEEYEQLSADEVREFATDITNETYRLDRLITELLDLERMKSGHMTIHRAPLDLNELMAQIVGRVASSTPTHHFQSELQALPVIEADADRITQVLMNLLSNAIKYSPDGGTIQIRSECDGDAIHIQVRDCGMGIPQEALETIFQPYNRFDSERTRHINGTGLGLPIVREIVELHGGKVWAESEVDQGSTFNVTLPLSTPL